MRRRVRRVEEEPSVNITPLIDVVFVVLFTFIVIAPLLEVEKVQLAEGLGKIENKSSPSPALTIHVLKDNTILLNKKKVALKELPQMLERIKKREGKKRVELYHDKQATFGTYQSVKNAVDLAGFEEMDLLLHPR